MNRYFRGTIEPYGNNRRTSADGCIADHIMVLPCARAHMAWENRLQSDWNAAGKADLSTVGVPAQEQPKISIRGLLIYLWRVRQQNRKNAWWDAGRSLLNIVDAVEMCIIDTGY